MTQTSASRLRGFVCAVLVLVCTLLARPFAETGLDDDYSYIFSARALAQTGHVHYVGWASAMVGWQLALGAFFIKLFGFSFSVTRLPILLIAAFTAFVLHRLLVRCGLSAASASLVTLTTLLSPMALPLAFSFMTDMAGLFGTVVTLYSCVRALQSPQKRFSNFWLIAAMLFCAVAGTARQTVWLCLVTIVPCTAWLLRSRKPSFRALLPVWLVSCGIAYASVRWFYRQPYSVREIAVQNYIDRDLLMQGAANVARAVLQCCMLALPVLLAFVPVFSRASRKARLYSASAGVVAVLVFALAVHHAGPRVALLPFHVGGNFMSSIGVVDLPEIGTRPAGVPVWAQIAITLLTLLATAACAAFLLTRHTGHPAPTISDAETLQYRGIPLTTREVLWLTVPFTLVYLALVLHRTLFAFPYDRYFITLLPLAMLLLVRLYQSRVASELPTLSYAALGLLALTGIATLHDTYADRRAQLAAAQRLIDAGHPRTSFYAGFEYDGWTQIEQMGWMNVIAMQRPDGFHMERPIPRLMKVKPCGQQFAHLDPAIQPRYGISFDQSACDGPSEFAPETYRTWLPPFTRELYIRKVTTPAF